MKFVSDTKSISTLLVIHIILAQKYCSRYFFEEWEPNEHCFGKVNNVTETMNHVITNDVTYDVIKTTKDVVDELKNVLCVTSSKKQITSLTNPLFRLTP